MAFEHLKAKLSLDASEFKSEVQDAQEQLGDLQSRSERVGKKMQRAGKMMTVGITAPLTAMGAMAVRQSGNFEAAMQESIAVMGDVSESMREDLEETAREVATSTTRSHQEAAQSFYFLASAGLDAAEAMEAMPQVAAFAEAGQMNMAEATDVATNVMSAFGFEAEEMARVTDVLTATVSNHNQTMSDMASAMSKVAPTAASLGISIQDTAAAVGMLGDVGIQGERAGTGLNAILAQLSDSSSTAAQTLQEAGVQIRDAEGNMLPLADIIAQIEQSSLDAADASKIFGREAGPAAAALIREGSEAMQENASTIGQMEGATEDMAQTQRESFNAQMKIAKSNVNDAAIAMGAELIPYVRVLTSVVSDVAEGFTDLSSGQQKAIIAAGGLVAILGPTILLMGALISSAATISAAMGTAAAATSGYATVLKTQLVPWLASTSIAGAPVWALLLALAAAAAGLYAAWKTNFLGIRDHTQWAFGQIGDFINWLIDQINRIPGVDIDVGNAKQSMGDLKQSVSDTVPSIKTDFDEMEQTAANSEVAAPTFDQQNFDTKAAEAGSSAGSEFGSSFRKSAVTSLRPADVADTLQEDLEEVQAEQKALDPFDNPERARELHDRIQNLQSKIEEAESADSIAELDEELVAEAAAQNIEAEREKKQFVQDVLEELKDQGVAAEDAQGQAKADIVVQSDGEDGNGKSDEEVIRKTLEEMQSQSDSGSASGSGSQQETRRQQLKRIVQQLKALRDEILTDGDVLDLSGPIRINGDVVSMDEVEARLDLEARRAENRLG